MTNLICVRIGWEIDSAAFSPWLPLTVLPPASPVVQTEKILLVRSNKNDTET